MSVEGERQPTIPLHILNKYVDCMEEIKKRTEVVHGFLRGELHAKYLPNNSRDSRLADPQDT